LVLAAIVCACSSGEEAAQSTPDTSVAETGPSDTGPGKWVWDGRPVYPEIVCGPGPYVEYAIQPYGLLVGDLSKKQPYTNIRVSMSACPEVKGVTDSEGYALLRLTTGKETSIKLEADGWIGTRSFDVTPQSWSETPFLSLIDPAAKPHLFGYAADKGIVMVDVASALGSLTCTGADAVKITVEGHPEAVVTYHEASTPYAPMTGATQTSPSGLASISGIAAGTKLTIKGEKTGCDVVVNGAPGTVTVDAGIVSRVSLVVRDPYPSCGPPPWILLEGTTTERMTTGMLGAVVPDVSLTFSACSGVSAKTDVAGKWHAWVSQNVPTWRRYEKTGYLPTFSTEQSWPVDYSTVDLAVRSEATWKPLMPGYDSTHAYAAIGISAPKSGTCAGPENVAIAIKGHPEAKVIYVDGDPPKDTGGKVTTKRGLVYVSGLTPGMLTDENVTATREGCEYTLKGGLDTGRAKLEAGAFTIATLYGKKAL
jgi:hypothetical protein